MNCQKSGDSNGVHWLDANEEISAVGMLHGVPARLSLEAYGSVLNLIGVL
ncbi:MAG: hypothetical protein VYA69_07770 [Gemmatimonadota bacterium]|nr:hypothetical protein [Gemmatimonadota bacterium]